MFVDARLILSTDHNTSSTSSSYVTEPTHITTEKY